MKQSNRTMTFLLIGSLMFLLYINLRGQFQPPPADGGDEAALVDNANGADGPDDTPVDGAQGDGAVDGQDAAQQGVENAGDQNAAAPDAPAQPQREFDPQRMFQIGSLDPTSGFRFLVTLNNQGATVRRVESNVLNSRGRLKYRNLETEGAYAGELELEETPSGLVVGTAGDGTPAAIAGIVRGDVITSVAGTPVLTLENYTDKMKETKAGQVIDFGIRSGGSERTVQLKLTDKPMEIIRPEPATFDEDSSFPESFELTLRQILLKKSWPELDARLRSGTWKAKPYSASVDGENVQGVEFTYTLSAAELAPFEIPGPILVTKRYSLVRMTEEQADSADARTWHIRMDVEIENLSDSPAELAFQLNGPTGTPTESWWYQIKIHGGSSLFKSAAGARDIVASSARKPFVFIGGPEIAKSAHEAYKKKRKPEVHWLFEQQSETAEDVRYVGVDTLYFSSVILPHTDSRGEAEEEPKSLDVYSAMAWHTADDAKIPSTFKTQKLVDVTPYLFKDVNLEPASKYSQSFDLFCGPKESEILANYGLEETVAYGWFGFISKPLCWLLHSLYWITGKFTYAIPIIILTVLVRMVMIPFSRKAALNAQMMQHLSPKMKEIAAKYKDDMEKRSQAQRELFKKHKYNPFGGCAMMFFQLPIFLGLYRGLSVDIALRDQPLIPGLSWCSNLAAPDQFMRWDSWMPSWLAGEAGWLGPYLNILPLVTMVLFIVQQKLFTPPATDEQQAMMQKMMSFMMIFMGILFFKVPAGLCIYFITSSLWGIIERKMLPKPKLDTSKFDLESDSDSLTVDPAESYSNETQLAERKRLDKERKKKLRNRGM